jgi:hypothetical protein
VEYYSGHAVKLKKYEKRKKIRLVLSGEPDWNFFKPVERRFELFV